MSIKESKIKEINKHLSSITSFLESSAVAGVRIDKVESSLLSSLLSLGQELLSHYISLAGEVLSVGDDLRSSSAADLVNKGYRSRSYRSVFGRISYSRKHYYSEAGGSYYPLDAYLGFPRGHYSYLLCEWLGYGSVSMTFDQSSKYLSHILGQDFKAMQASRCTYDLAKEVEAYYQPSHRLGLTGEEEATYLSASFDGKGVPIKRSETDRAKESIAHKLSVGQKKRVKKEATVSITSSFTPKSRTPNQLLDAFFSIAQPQQIPKKAPAPKWHQNKHMRAFLSNKVKAIDYGLEQLIKRNPHKDKPIIILIDGDRDLEKKIKLLADKKEMTPRIDAYILDFIHVIEYLWKVATPYWGAKNPQRLLWVKKQAKLLLEGKVELVIKQWKKIQTQEKEKDKPRSGLLYYLRKSLIYFTNHKHMMQYKQYLDKGYPITTGTVESACGHYVKARLDQNAMHWGKQGAQQMLDIRAVLKNKHWKTFIDYYIDKSVEQIYSHKAA